MPLALKAKEAREYDRHNVHGGLRCIIDTRIPPNNPLEKMLLHWKEQYKAKIAQRAIAFVCPLTRFSFLLMLLSRRARYLRLPPAPLKSGPSRPLSKLMAPKSNRSASPENPARRSLEEAVKTRIGSSRAASPGPSTHGIRLLTRPRPLLAGGLLTGRIVSNEREGTVSSAGTRLSNEVRPWANLVREGRPRFAPGLYMDRGRSKRPGEGS
jgi:hypothetical protein